MEYKNLKTTKKGGLGNIIYEGIGFDISYNPCVSVSICGGGGEEETALLVENDFMILNGDFRKEYDECKNLEQALIMYDNYKDEYGSKWSTV